MSFLDVVFGRRLATEEEEQQRIGPWTGVPVLGLDALSSAAYGPEAALTLLIPLGAAGLGYFAPILAVIVGILLVVFFSYRQTIAAYPGGGGSYTVSKENLGVSAALLAGAALAIDYVLNVAVGISAGVGALVSAFPGLLPHTLALCLATLALLTLVNLRGTRESGITFLVPTYLFVASLGVVLVVGLVKTVASGGHPVAAVALPVLPASTEAASVWMILRAFASGCTAMTGVEAVSNAVPIFRAPATRGAQQTLTALVAILVSLLLGIGFVAHAYGIGATPPGESGYQSVLSQLVAAVIGRGGFYYVTLASIVAVLALSANTSFADFPRLCRVLALDRFLPDFFAVRGRRLVFSAGVVVLAALAAALLVAFGGVTDRLIPLFAVGAFLAFTLSQAGMTQHWRRLGGPGARRFAWINGLGTVATGVTLVVVVVSKFAEGAWLTVLVVPAMVWLFRRTSAHYGRIAAEIAREAPLDLAETSPPIAVVPVQAWNELAQRGLRFAMELSPEVIAVHVFAEATKARDLTPQWEGLVAAPARAAGRVAPRLVTVASTFRQFFSPLIDYVLALRDAHPGRNIVVVIPDLVVRRWYHALLHNNRGAIMRSLLRLRGGSRVIVVNTPFHLHD